MRETPRICKRYTNEAQEKNVNPISSHILRLQRLRCDSNNDDKTSKYQSSCHECNEDDSSSTRRKFVTDDIVLAFEISIIADEEYHHGNAQKCCA